MKIKSIFLTHYLPALLYVTGAILLAFLPLFFTEKIEKQEILAVIMVMILLILVLTFILGFLKSRFLDAYYLKRKKKTLEKKLFNDLVIAGFYKIETSVYGYIEGFLLFITPERGVFTEEKWLEIKILFNPKQQNQFISKKTLNELIKDKAFRNRNYSWSLNSLEIKKRYGFKLPKYNKLMNVITDAIDVLKNNKFVPIEYEEWNKTVNETMRHYNQVYSEIK